MNKKGKIILLSRRKIGLFIGKVIKIRTRHMEKVKEAIHNNLPDLISEESIIYIEWARNHQNSNSLIR